MNFKTIKETLLADTLTPVATYLRLRDAFDEVILLESSDYHSRDNSKSFICCEPLATFEASAGKIKTQRTGQTHEETVENGAVLDRMQGFFDEFQNGGDTSLNALNGFYGYSTFEAVQYYDTLKPNAEKAYDKIPDLRFSFYRYVLIFNHFNGDLTLLENVLDAQPAADQDGLQKLKNLLFTHDLATFKFETVGQEESLIQDQDFLEMVEKGKAHCQRGDVFQIVLSRRFKQRYKGDEFNVYRALRNINPSPYLFYFDYGSYKIFGSSPEAQLVVSETTAQIHPIAGTYRRTGNDEHDAAEALKLTKDPKENAEHVMLVDLARNDLSKHTKNVEVLNYKEIQYFSHVIHLVSKVEGHLHADSKALQIFADTFPAGTLSGAPKYRALELIADYEKHHRSFYGGAIGLVNLNGQLNTAIIIRSFLARNNELHYQAGAGVVIDSVPENELQEVNNKLAALKRALKMGEQIV